MTTRGTTPAQAGLATQPARQASWRRYARGRGGLPAAALTPFGHPVTADREDDDSPVVFTYGGQEIAELRPPEGKDTNTWTLWWPDYPSGLVAGDSGDEPPVENALSDIGMKLDQDEDEESEEDERRSPRAPAPGRTRFRSPEDGPLRSRSGPASWGDSLAAMPRLGFRRASIADADADFLDRALKENETVFVEWKEVPPREGLGPTVASFANTLGGWFILGVEDATGKPVGWKPPGRDNIQDWVRNRLANEVDPAPPFVAREVEHRGKPLGLIRVFESSDTPHVVTTTGSLFVRTEGGKEHVRDHSTVLALAQRGELALAKALGRLDDWERRGFASSRLGAPPDRMTRVEGSWTVVVRGTPMTVLPDFADRTYDRQTVERFIERTDAPWSERKAASAAELQAPHQFGFLISRSIVPRSLRAESHCQVLVAVDAGGVVGIRVDDPLNPDRKGLWEVATPGFATEYFEPFIRFIAESLSDLEAIGRCRTDVYISGFKDHGVVAAHADGRIDTVHLYDRSSSLWTRLAGVGADDRIRAKAEVPEGECRRPWWQSSLRLLSTSSHPSMIDSH